MQLELCSATDEAFSCERSCGGQEVRKVTTYRLGAVDVSGKADDQVVCDGVDQVSEAGVAIQNVIQRR